MAIKPRKKMSEKRENLQNVVKFFFFYIIRKEIRRKDFFDFDFYDCRRRFVGITVVYFFCLCQNFKKTTSGVLSNFCMGEGEGSGCCVTVNNHVSLLQ